MTELTFEELLKAAQKLNPEQKATLAQSLQRQALDTGPTREELIAELESLRIAGAFEMAESLRNQYARPALNSLTDQQLLADLYVAATEWEQDLNELTGDAD
jgi:hypothetical protein